MAYSHKTYQTYLHIRTTQHAAIQTHTETFTHSHTGPRTFEETKAKSTEKHQYIQTIILPALCIMQMHSRNRALCICEHHWSLV